MVEVSTEVRAGSPRTRVHPVTVFAMTESVPDWAIQLGAGDGLEALVDVDVAGRSTVVLMDSSLLDAKDASWVEGIESSLGPVIAVCADQSEGHRARAYGARAAVPCSLLHAPAEVAMHVIEDILHAPPVSTDKMERYMRDAIHEFRTPLTVISEFAGLCEDGIGGPLTERQEVYIGYILSAVDRLGEHFDDYRDGVRMRLGSLQHGKSCESLRPVLENAVVSMGAEPVRLGVADTLQLDQVDGQRLTEALKRLIGGAQKLGAKGQPVTVAVRRVDGVAEIRVTFLGAVVSLDDIEVMAQGTMMREDGFYRSVARVFGLGVSMARLFLAQSGGTLRLEVEEGVSGAFVATVPIDTASQIGLMVAEPTAGAA